MKNIKLSVLLPAMNVADYISQALDSILMQEVDFDYEIIVCNDASTDNTVEIIKEYQKKYSHIQLLTNESNLGLSATMCKLLSCAKGKYFCVLDGDDFYTVRNKLQKQVDFLDSDIKDEYIAVCHDYIRLFGDKMQIEAINHFSNTENDFNYANFMYYHTSTQMYKNIFQGEVPTYFKDKILRSENARMWFFLKHTGKKVRKLNFVGSVYRYTELGIWSGSDAQKKKQFCIDFFSAIKNNLYTGSNFELNRFDYLIDNANKQDFTKYMPENLLGIEEALAKVRAISSIYSFHDRIVFHKVYKSELLDSLCETIGRIQLNLMNLSPMRSRESSNNILITVGSISHTGGGVTHEIMEIMEFYKDSNVNIVLLVTDFLKEDVNKNSLNPFRNIKNLTILFAKERNKQLSLKKLFSLLIGYNFEKVYHYVGHHIPLANSLIQTGIYGKNICVFSYDHGFSFGLDNSSYNCYIAKTDVHYKFLQKAYKNKVIYIPVWNKEKTLGNLYVPFNQHENIITASAAARYYKFSEGTFDYISLIVKTLHQTNGSHVHYGPMPDDAKLQLKLELQKFSIDPSNFIHIEWADNLAMSMYEQKVDLFINPFFVTSEKIALELQSAGFPMMCLNGKDLLNSPSSCFYEQILKWSNEEEFINIISNLNEETLLNHSNLARKNFEENHKMELVKPYFLNEQSFKEINNVLQLYINKVLDISILHSIFHNAIMGVLPSQQENKKKLKKSRLSRLFKLLFMSIKKTFKSIEKTVSFIRIGILIICINMPIIGTILFPKNFKEYFYKKIEKKIKMINK